MIFASPMPKPTTFFGILVVLASGLACHTIVEDDLIRQYGFERDSVRVELHINRDHTYTETFANGGKETQVNGSWQYTSGSQNLMVYNVWVPVVPLGSEHVKLEKTNFGFVVDPCGHTLCLHIDDDNELQLVGK